MIGFFDPSTVLGSETVQVTPTRAIGPFRAQVTIEERHSDQLVITDHPVESGAVISDHAYMLPASLVIRAGWSDSPKGDDSAGTGFLSGLGNLIGGSTGAALSNISSRLSGVSSATAGEGVGSAREMYQNMLELQKSRIPMEVLTGKRIYKNMLIRSIDTTTDKENENSIVMTIELREIMIVTTQVVTVGAPPEDQEEPEATTPVAEKGTKQLTPASNYDASAGDASAAASFPVNQSTVTGQDLGPL